MDEAIVLVMAFALAITAGALAICSLAWRDKRKHSQKRDTRSLQERIGDVARNARSSVMVLQMTLDGDYGKDAAAADWLRPAIAYYQRLESLASSPSTSAKEASDFAEETLRFLREKRIKGISLADEAFELADLVRQRQEAVGGQW